MKTIPIYNNIEGKLKLPEHIAPLENAKFYDHHFQSTEADNLIEFAGRVCYESFSQKNTRNSKSYHQHINEVNHRNVQEHYCFNFCCRTDELHNFINKPGVWVDPIDGYLSVNINARSANEQVFHSTYINEIIKQILARKCPLASLTEVKNNFAIDNHISNICTPENTWYSFFIQSVSRNLSHEFVRHRWRTAVSQRSTRYVDESSTPWIWHPLVEKYWGEVKNLTDLPERQNALYHGNTLESLESHCQSLYTNLCTFLQDRLIESGVDKFTARKQARGAARGCLGSCLGTEYVFSASIAEWKHIILSRGNNAADAEIRLIANEIFDYLAPRHPEIFGNCTKQVAIDGFGYHIEQK